MSNGSSCSTFVPIEGIKQSPNPPSPSTARKYKRKESSTIPPQNAQGDPVLKVWIMSLNRHVSTDEIVRGLNKIEDEDVRGQCVKRYKLPLPTAIASVASNPAPGSNAGTRQSGPAGIETYAVPMPLGADNQAFCMFNKRPVRTVEACLSCRKRKLRCDSVRPNCGNCTRRAIKCDVEASPKRLRRRLPPPTIDAYFLNDHAPQLASATRDHEQASDNLQSPFPVNIVPHPGSQPGSRNKWQLLEASREHWNPNALEPLTSNGISPLPEFARQDHDQARVLADLAKMYIFTPRPELRPLPDSHPYLYYLFTPPPTAALRTQAVAHPTLASVIPISGSTTPNPEITGTRGCRTAASDRGGSMKAGEVKGLMYENVPLIDVRTGVVHYPSPGRTSGMTGGGRIGAYAEKEMQEMERGERESRYRPAYHSTDPPTTTHALSTQLSSFPDPQPTMSPLSSTPCQFCGTTTSNIPCSCIEARSLTPTIATTTTAKQYWRQWRSEFLSSQLLQSSQDSNAFLPHGLISPSVLVSPAQSPVLLFPADESRPRIVPVLSFEHLSQTLHAEHTSLQQQQLPPSTSPPTPSSTRICIPSIAPYSHQSQHSLSPLTPLANLPPASLPTTSTTPWLRADLSFTPPDSFTPPSSALQPSPPIRMPSTRLPPLLTRTSTQVGGPPPDALENPEVWEKVLQGAAMLAYGNLSLSAAMLNVNTFSSNPITKIPLVIATTTAFFAVVLHELASLHLHVFESAHHIKRPLVLLVAFLGLSVFATLFALPAHSWSQEECNPYCWAERALVSTVIIWGFASLMIGGWRMRGANGRLVANLD